jgi:hypothetical protein
VQRQVEGDATTLAVHRSAVQLMAVQPVTAQLLAVQQVDDITP